jgi:hypothetical protein
METRIKNELTRLSEISGFSYDCLMDGYTSFCDPIKGREGMFEVEHKPAMKIIRRAVDLACMYNYPVDHVVFDIKCAMTGSYDGIKKYGVYKMPLMVQQELVKRGRRPGATYTIDGYDVYLTGVRLDIILRETKRYEFAAEKLSQTFSGQQWILRMRAKEFWKATKVELILGKICDKLNRWLGRIFKG